MPQTWDIRYYDRWASIFTIDLPGLKNTSLNVLSYLGIIIIIIGYYYYFSESVCMVEWSVGGWLVGRVTEHWHYETRVPRVHDLPGGRHHKLARLFVYHICVFG